MRGIRRASGMQLLELRNLPGLEWEKTQKRLVEGMPLPVDVSIKDTEKSSVRTMETNRVQLYCIMKTEHEHMPFRGT
jgi:hypothetical protein